jgi:DNA-binding LytR/AlgR family response regulator
LRWLGGEPFVHIGNYAVVNLHAIAYITHYGDRLYRVRLRDRVATEIKASRSGAARLAALLKTKRWSLDPEDLARVHYTANTSHL